MDPLNSISCVGFRLQGKIDNHHDYDILIKPGEDEIKAQVTNTKENKNEERKVELKNIASSLEAITKIFLKSKQNVKVSSHHPLFKDKYLLVELETGFVKAYPQVHLHIEGQSKGKSYQIDLDPFNLDSKQGQVNINGIFIPATIDLGFLKNKTVKELKVQIPTLSTALEVDIQENDLGPCLVFSSKIMSPVPQISQPLPAPAAPTVDKVPLLQVSTVSQLAKAFRDDPLLTTAVEELVNEVTNKVSPSRTEIECVVNLVDAVTTHDGFRIVNTLLGIYQKSPLTDEVVLQALTTILTRFYRILFQRMVNEARLKKDDFPTPPVLRGFDPAHFVELLKTLTERLNNTHTQPSSSLVCKQIEATIALLEIMTIKEVADLEKKLHEEAYKAIAKFEANSNLRVRYLSNYGKQTFTHIPNDVSNFKSFLTRAFYFARGCAKMADAISLVEPWHIASIFEAIPDFKKAFNMHQGEKEWFVNLHAIRQMIFEVNPPYLIELMHAVQKQYAEVKKEMDFNDPLFVQGFTDTLWDVLNMPSFGSHDFKVKSCALRALVKIYINNASYKNRPFSLKEDKERAQLRELTLTYLQSCKQHPQEEIKAAANKVITKHLKNERLSHTTLSIAFEGTAEIMTRVIDGHVPLLGSMHRVLRNLELDIQLQREKPYFIDLDAKKDALSRAEPLKTKLKAFLESKTASVLFLEADGGGGKSLGMKEFLEEMLLTYPQSRHFPFYVYLPQLVDPLHGGIRDTLKEIGIVSGTHAEDELKKRPTLFVFDAWDEVDLNTHRDLSAANLWINYGFNYWPHAKVIFCSRKGIADPTRFSPRVGQLERLVLAPFDPSKVYAYFDKAVPARKKECLVDSTLQPLLWNKKEYKANFKEMESTSLWSVITNPFKLKITTEAFPIIVNKLLTHNPKLEIKNIFQGKNEQIIARMLFKVYASVMAHRASEKTMLRGQFIPPVHFLEYMAKIAERMEKFKMYSIPWPTDDHMRTIDRTLESHFGDLFDSPHKFFYTQCLVSKKEGWSFEHKDYQVFFTSIGQDPDELEKLIDVLKEYGLDEMTRGST